MDWLAYDVAALDLTKALENLHQLLFEGITREITNENGLLISRRALTAEVSADRIPCRTKIGASLGGRRIIQLEEGGGAVEVLEIW